MKNLLFVRLDADNIGDSIELALLDNDWKRAQQIHNTVQEGIKELTDFISKLDDTKILLLGCDDILFCLSKELYDTTFANSMQSMFKISTGFTLSIGIGETPFAAISNLRRAKLSGRNKIVF